VRLKAIEIQGFKSFPDKTLLTFSDGVTAVVGPNGSGKSNISDAIRWVLGEQSARTLRGGRMEDVIFGGTRKRSSMGFCEVSITVDNSDGSIPLEYNEITVTRRYYRSGESEFYINRRAARLKDVREMFMDTGLGIDGYAMIGQGRIDEILSVKSAERREIFEEAAGISKVRLRREESDRKLQKAEENLVRLRDIIGELETRVAPLKEQAEKAKKYLLLRDELRDIEVALAVSQLDRLEGLIKTAKIDHDNAERLLASRKSELERSYEKSSGLSEKIRNKDVELEEARNALAEIRERLAECESNHAVAQSELINATLGLESGRREVEMRESRKAELEARLGEKNDLKAELEAKYAAKKSELEALLDEIEEARKQSGDTEGRIEGMRAALSQATEEEHGKLAEIMSVNAAVEETASRGESIFWQRKEAQDRLSRHQEALEESHERLEEIRAQRESALNTLGGYDMMAKVREDKAEKTRSAFDRLEREYNAGADRLDMLKAMERDLDGFSFAVKKIAQAGSGLRGIHGPLSTLIKTDDKYSVAIETALGNAMQNIVTDDENCAKAAIGYLKSNNFGRATFLPVTSIKPRWKSRSALEGERGFCGYANDLVASDKLYSDIISSLLGTTAIVDNIDRAIEMGRKHKYAFRIVTLDGQLISAGGALTGGSTVKSTGVLSRSNEIDRLEERLGKAKDELAAARSAMEKAQRELNDLASRRKSAEAELRLVDEKLSEENAEYSRCQAAVEATERLMADYDSETEKCAARRTELKNKLADLEKDAKLFADKRSSLRAQLDELLKDAETDVAAAGRLSEELGRLRLESSTLAGEIRAAEDSAAMISELLRGAAQELQDKEDQLGESEKSITELTAAIEEQKRLIADNEGLRLKAEGHIEKLTGERLELEGKRTKTEKDIQTKNNDIVNQERLRSSLEHKRDQLIAEEKGLLDKLWESYELTRTTAKELCRRTVEQKYAAKRISELRAQIRSLGSVNLGAVAEYDEVSSRYEFLSAQRDDLEKAKADLTQVIRQLTGSMQEAFVQKFKQIDRAFSQTFTDIFGGGRASLELEDEKNVLECGINISVELPGKGQRVISLLSGGEKAFVAIALYFAIIKVSPTPFCVLDEIDAALDEMNVSRFSEYMNKLCGSTQFIVITHRRGTMEGSDILYGATMQEQGVTKLLKLDIREVESKLNIKLS